MGAVNRMTSVRWHQRGGPEFLEYCAGCNVLTVGKIRVAVSKRIIFVAVVRRLFASRIPCCLTCAPRVAKGEIARLSK